MRFQKLKINNIAGLKGQHEIDFTAVALNSEIFAITGATGAGKSTVLSAISLSLFGDNFKRELNNADLVTLGESIGATELYFSFAGKEYCAKWSCRVRKKSGDILKVPLVIRSLSLNGELLDTSPSNLLGLNFNQFCKTVILNQGEFSRFLMSSFNERKDILECICHYQGDTFVNLSKILRYLFRESESRMKIVEAEIIGVNLPPTAKDDVALMRSELLQLKEKREKYKKTIIDQEKLLKSVELREKLILEENKTAQNIKQYQQEKIQTGESCKKIERDADVVRVKLQKAKKEYNELAPRLKQAISYVVRIDHMQKSLQQQKIIINDYKRSQQHLIKKERLLKEEKSSLIKEIKEQFSLIAKIDFTKVVIIRERIDRVQNLNNNSSLLENSIFSFTTQLQNLQKQEKSISGLIESTYLNIKNVCLQKNINSDCFSEILPTVTLLIKDLELQQETFRSNVQEINSQRVNYLELKKMYLQELSVKENKVRDLEILLSQHEKDDLYLENLDDCYNLFRHSLTKANCLVCRQRIDLNAQNKLEQFYQDKMEKDNSGNKNLMQKREELEKIIFLSQEKITQFIKNMSDKNVAHEDLNYANKKLSDINIKLDDMKNIQEKLRPKIYQYNISQKELASVLPEKQQMSVDLAKFTKQNEQNRAKQLEVLALLKSDLPYTSNISNSFEQLQTQFIADYEKFQSLEKKKIRANMLDQQLLHIQDNIKRETLRITNGNKTVEEINQELITDERMLKTLLPSGCLAKEVDGHLAQLEANLGKYQIEEKKVIKFLHELEIERSKVEALYSENLKLNRLQKEKLEKEFENLKGTLDILLIQKSLAKIKIQFEETIGSSSKLQENEKALLIKTEHVDLLNKRKGKLKEKYNRLSNLFSLLGRDEFRNFALGMVENLLIEQANSELTSLCDGRYQLLQKSTKQGHEFYVQDKLSACLVRKVSTLSGGEIFLISLALALSLAEIMRGETEIDSFFIDEGFGSLDEESMEDALEILLKVRNRGKQIGVISHVKLLTNRIPLNIHIHKNTDDGPRLEIILN